MQPAITPYSIILVVGAAQGLFLALALLNARGGNAIANRILALLTLAFVLDLSDEFLYQARYYFEYPHLTGLEEANNFFYGPLVYLYVCALTTPGGFRFTGNQWLHFLPFLASFVLLAPVLTLDAEQKIEAAYGDIDIVGTHLVWAARGIDLATLANLVQIGIYVSLAILRLTRHARTIRENFSYTERISLTWLRNLMIGLSLLYLNYLFGALFAENIGLGEKIENVNYLAIVVCIYIMGYLGLRQPAIFLHLRPRREESKKMSVAGTDSTQRAVDKPPPPPKKYEKSALDENLSEALLIELLSHMETAKPHLDSRLTLPQLAEQLKISPNYLSQVINERQNQNFFDFINHYRIEEAKKYLSNPDNEKANILTIALDAGFNSKSPFYTAFKKHTDMTPNQFRQSSIAA